MPARVSAAYQAFVLTWRTGWPRKLNTDSLCFPVCLRIDRIASLFMGTGGQALCAVGSPR
jgi:hypothetical protein